MKRFTCRQIIAIALIIGCFSTLPLFASSHREAPSITRTPQVDGTDFYMFRSYEPGRQGFVTLIANYNPLQDPYGGPNYFPLDADAVYDIHINNNGADITEDLTFRFRFRQRRNPFVLSIGGVGVAVPLVNIGQFGPGLGLGALSERRSFTLEVVRGSVDNPNSSDFVINNRNGLKVFGMPRWNWAWRRAMPLAIPTVAVLATTRWISRCAR